jgi:hypothetical protein
MNRNFSVTLEEWNNLVSTIKSLKSKVDQIPMPFKLLYRPPEREEYLNIVEFMDEVDSRLKALEERWQQ